MYYPWQANVNIYYTIQAVSLLQQLLWASKQAHITPSFPLSFSSHGHCPSPVPL